MRGFPILLTGLLCRLLRYGLPNYVSGLPAVGRYDCESWYVQVMMLFDLVPDGSFSLPDINHTTFTGDVVHAMSSVGHLPQVQTSWREADSSGTICGQHPGTMVEHHTAGC